MRRKIIAAATTAVLAGGLFAGYLASNAGVHPTGTVSRSDARLTRRDRLYDRGPLGEPDR
jgi:hypothetical protein